VNVWVTLDRGHWADTPALLGSAIEPTFVDAQRPHAIKLVLLG
jgi:hypothetical protein